MESASTECWLAAEVAMFLWYGMHIQVSETERCAKKM